MDNTAGGGQLDRRVSWSDERIERLKTLWKSGETASEIGEELGLSRGAIMGKVHRLDLPMRAPSGPKRDKRGFLISRDNPIVLQRKREKREEAAARMRAARIRDRLGDPPTNDPKDIWAISEAECRLPVKGEGAAMLYCAAPSNGSWCPYHSRMVWREG